MFNAFAANLGQGLWKTQGRACLADKVGVHYELTGGSPEQD